MEAEHREEMVTPIPEAEQAGATISNGEKIAFRFLLLAWGTGVLMLAASGASYFQWRSVSDKVDSSLTTLQACMDKVEKYHSACRTVGGNFVTFDQCMSVRDAECGALFFKDLVQRRDDLSDRAHWSLHYAAGLFAISTLLFYVLRWAVTGRIRPLWLWPR